MPNVFISSISKKIPLIQAARDALNRFSPNSLIIGGDLDPKCLGQYFVDRFWQMPSIKELTIHELIAYCQKEDVQFIIPTRDGELSFYAEHQMTLQKEGVRVMISPGTSVALALDKYAFSQKIERSIPTFLDACQLTFPCVAKERYGAGSRAIGLRLQYEQAVEHGRQLENAVYQPYIEGSEISVDLYVRKDGGIHGMVCRERNVIVNGESQVTTTFRNEKIEALCISAAKQMKLYGHVMFQLIREAISGSVFLLECNPRFGGASTASVKAGLDSFFWFYCEAKRRELPRCMRLEKEIKMVRHAEDMFIEL